MKNAKKNKVFEVQILLDKFLFFSFQIDLGGWISPATRLFYSTFFGNEKKWKINIWLNLSQRLALISLHKTISYKILT